MNYENMTDFEINKALAEKDKRFNSCIDVEFFMSDSNEKAVDVVSQGLLICTVDYCTWAYGGIIIQNANISINAKSNCDYEVGMCQFTCEWSACAFSSCDGEFGMSSDIIECTNENPLRAAMIVYLMMQEEL